MNIRKPLLTILCALCLLPAVAQPLALRTNLLYDVVLVPNVGVELALADSWTVSANGLLTWISNSDSHRCWRLYGGDAEVRYWPGHEAFSSHHVGVYGGIYSYDFEFGGTGWQSPHSYTVGLSYGYSLSVSRSLSLDFSAGFGYLWGTYKEYKPQNDHLVWQADKNRRYWGPTKAEATLVWHINRKRL